MVCCAAAMVLMAGLVGVVRAARRLIGLEPTTEPQTAFAPPGRYVGLHTGATVRPDPERVR